MRVMAQFKSDGVDSAGGEPTHRELPRSDVDDSRAIAAYTAVPVLKHIRLLLTFSNFRNEFNASLSGYRGVKIRADFKEM